MLYRNSPQSTHKQNPVHDVHVQIMCSAMRAAVHNANSVHQSTRTSEVFVYVRSVNLIDRYRCAVYKAALKF